MNVTTRSRARALSLAVCLGCLAPGIALAAPARIQSHEASYLLRLAESGSGGLSDARGRIEFQWAEFCDGWRVNQKTYLVLTDADGRNHESGWTLQAWEAKDGLRYLFDLERVEKDEEPFRTKGVATLEGPGLGGKVKYELPRKRERRLPAGTVFPTQHTREILQAAEAGDLLLWRHIFDGTDENDLFGVNALIGPPIGSEVPPKFDRPMLHGVRSWRVQLAFFLPDERIAEPDHTQNQRLYANGVVDELTFDYADFSLTATLQALTPIPASACTEGD